MYIPSFCLFLPNKIKQKEVKVLLFFKNYIHNFKPFNFAPTETKPIAAPDSVSLDDIRSAFDEIEPPIQASTPAPSTTPTTLTASDSISFGGNDDDDGGSESEAETDPEEFHLRFNAASAFAKNVNDAADNLLQITDNVKVIKHFPK